MRERCTSRDGSDGGASLLYAIARVSRRPWLTGSMAAKLLTLPITGEKYEMDLLDGWRLSERAPNG